MMLKSGSGCRVHAYRSWPLSGKWIGAFLRYDMATVERDRMRVAASHNSTQDCAPFLRWAGSKPRLLPVLKTFWPETQTLRRAVRRFGLPVFRDQSAEGDLG
jgi:hypothetical protein